MRGEAIKYLFIKSMRSLFVLSQSISCPEKQTFIKWCLHLWMSKGCLHLTVLSHRLQGIATPSKWFASMWSLITWGRPSFPHALQILPRSWRSPCLPCIVKLFSLVSIIDLTTVSSICKSPVDSSVFCTSSVLGMATAWFLVSMIEFLYE